ncbi:unnamed protein product [Malus baccata var. baccata]
MAVKFVQVCRVAPQPGSRETYEVDPAVSESISQVNHALLAQEYLSLPLTFFDLVWLRYPPFHRLFFYDILPCSSPADTLLFFHSTIIPKLKTSLSIALQHFLPWPETLLGPKTPPNPPSIMSKATPFPSHGGFSVGISMHHAAVDGKILFMFLKSWTHMCKHVHQSDDMFFPDQLKSFYDRRGVKDPFCLQLEDIYSNQFLNMDRRQNNRSNFEFTSTKIQALRKWVLTRMEETTGKQEEGHDRSVHLSTFSLTCAWVCLLKAEQEEVKGDIISMAFSVDCRSRLTPPLPANYFGNCVTGCLAPAERKGLLGEDGWVVAKLVNGLYPSDEQTSSGAGHQRLFTTAGSHRFDITEVVRINRIGTITFADGKNGSGAVDVGLVLKNNIIWRLLLLYLLKVLKPFKVSSLISSGCGGLMSPITRNSSKEARFTREIQTVRGYLQFTSFKSFSRCDGLSIIKGLKADVLEEFRLQFYTELLAD